MSEATPLPTHMAQGGTYSTSPAAYQEIINKHIDDLDTSLHDINRKIHQNPELGYEEYKAHDNVAAFLRSQGFSVTPHAFGLETSFVCGYGSDDGPLVAFNVEYDALPGIGHACGHNLIATGSIAAFLGTVAAMKKYSLPGRARCLGTPAEEGGGGKLKLISAGAYQGVSACFMTHPFSTPKNVAYGTCMASAKFRATFTGKPAHAAAAPWEGVNALDAAVLAYNGTSMLRQQIKPGERIQGVMIEGGHRANIITPKSVLDYNVRGATLRETKVLQERVVKCFEGAAIATGCEVEFLETNTYADLRPSRALCLAYSEVMKSVAPEQSWPVGETEEPGAYSTDQGNVSHIVPSFHGLYIIPIKDNAANHTPGFTDAAATDEAHRLTLLTSKGMAGVAVRMLFDKEFSNQVGVSFKKWVSAQH